MKSMMIIIVLIIFGMTVGCNHSIDSDDCIDGSIIEVDGKEFFCSGNEYYEVHERAIPEKKPVKIYSGREKDELL